MVSGVCFLVAELMASESSSYATEGPASFSKVARPMESCPRSSTVCLGRTWKRHWDASRGLYSSWVRAV